MPPNRRHFGYVQLLILALLICDTAAGLASGLAGSLAFAAAAILRALTQIAGLDGLNVFHGNNLHKKCSHLCYHNQSSKSTRQRKIILYNCQSNDFYAVKMLRCIEIIRCALQ